MKLVVVTGEQIRRSGHDLRAGRYVESDMARIKKALKARFPGQTVRLYRTLLGWRADVTQVIKMNADGVETKSWR